MRILVIVDSININDSSGSKANVALIRNLSKAGYEVTVLHYTHMSIELEGVTSLVVPESKWNLLYLLSRTERVYTRLTKISLNWRLENWFGFSFTYLNDSNSIAKTLNKYSPNDFELVLTLSKGASFRPHKALLKSPHWHKKWMAYVHDPYPFHFYPRPYNWVQPGFRQKERFFKEVSEKARYSAFPSLLLKEWMASYFPNFEQTGMVIPHQNAVFAFENEKLPSYFDAAKFNLLHAGNLMKPRSPKGLLEGFKLFLEQYPEARSEAQLLLLGPASYHEKLLEEYRSIPEIYIYNRNVPFDEVYNLQKAVSVNVILESKSEISPFLPGKFPHCVEADKPILLLGPHYSETRRLLGENYPFKAEVNDTPKIAALIEGLYLKWKDKPGSLVLEKPDLKVYLSHQYLKKIILELYL